MAGARLVDRAPTVPAQELIAGLVPPRHFHNARFDTYLPDRDQPSQLAALGSLQQFAGHLGDASRRLFGRRRTQTPGGVYLDGGYGVGKTHLLASLWHASPEPRAYGTFVEITHLVGALGFNKTVEALSGHRLLAIDEFELDDPGDTVLVSTLLARLSDEGVSLAATSNTLPGALGEGRFAAQDFLREIQGLSARFTPIRIDGEDYRHRGQLAPPGPVSTEQVRQRAATTADATCDDFDALQGHLAELHPSRYGALVEGVSLVGLTDVHPVHDQAAALRLVVLVDRLYDREVPVLVSGTSVEDVFPDDLLSGGYRKKYLRALSRLTALARQTVDG